ncbi:hypothetical protein Tco_0418714 [Tanacetum coccineum]
MNQDFPCYNSLGLDQYQPPQYLVVHQPSKEKNIAEQAASFNDSSDFSDFPPQPQYKTYSCELCGNDHHYGSDCLPRFLFFHHDRRDELEESQNKLLNMVRLCCEMEIQQKQAAQGSSQNWKPPICYDEDEECSIQTRDYYKNSPIAIASDSPITDSLIMGNNEFEDLSEELSDNESECDVPVYDDSSPNFTTFSNPLFDSSDDFTSNDYESFFEEDVPKEIFKTYSNPLFDLDEEIISSEFNPIHNEDLDSTSKNDCFDTESYLFESLLNRDTLIASSSKIDSLLDEFAGELLTITPRIVNREHEEYISLTERLLYDNSSPRQPEDFHANPNTIIEPLPTFPIPVEDSDSLREEIDIFPGLEIQPLMWWKTSLLMCLIFCPSIPSFIWISTSFLLIMISDPILMFLLPKIETRFTIRGYALKSNPRYFFLPFLKSLLIFLIGANNFSKSPMMIYGGDMLILDVRYLHFYPP